MPVLDTDKPRSITQYADVFEGLLSARADGYRRVDGEHSSAFKIPFEAAGEMFEAFCSFSPDRPVLVIVKNIAHVDPEREESMMEACEDAERNCLHLNFAVASDGSISVRAASIFYAVEEQDFSWILALETITLHNEIVSAIDTHLDHIRSAGLD